MLHFELRHTSSHLLRKAQLAELQQNHFAQNQRSRQLRYALLATGYWAPTRTLPF